MKLLNIKTKDGWILLNDENKEAFSSINYSRFEKMLKLAEQYNHANVSESSYYSGNFMSLRSMPEMP